MNNIFVFGDSQTWGYCPQTAGRHPVDCRWPNVLSAGLGGDVAILSDGLRGRTTGYDDYLANCDRNGVRLLPTALFAHAPIDLVILMLGCNDMKGHICGSAIGAMHGMRRLIQIAKAHDQGMAPAKYPEILIISPPPLCETKDPEFSALFSSGIDESYKLAGLYSTLATQMGVAFFDAGSVSNTDPADGVHMDRENTRALGKALVPVVRELLNETN